MDHLLSAYAVVEPLAMVVESLHTSVADVAMP